MNWKNLTAEQKRLAKEVVALIVMAIIVLFVFVIKPGQTPTTSNKGPTAAPIKTNFNTSALDQINSQQNDYPTVNDNNLGRTDPFAPIGP